MRQQIQETSRHTEKNTRKNFKQQLLNEKHYDQERPGQAQCMDKSFLLFLIFAVAQFSISNLKNISRGCEVRLKLGNPCLLSLQIVLPCGNRLILFESVIQCNFFDGSSIILTQLRMCFIKKVEMHGEPIIYPCEHQCYYYSMQFFNPPQPHITPAPHSTLPLFSPLDFPSLMQQVSKDITATIQRITINNSAIYCFAEKLKQNQILIDAAYAQLEENLAKVNGRAGIQVQRMPHCELNQIPFFSHQPIISKIFGQRQYKFKLTLLHNFPKTIYKQRNLNIAVKLTNPDGQSLYNANLIHLCMGVCNSHGQWIVMQDGDFFMQGKIQVDLYHGEAQFKKVSPKDVSRHFHGGVVSIIVYPKKSLVNFTGEVSKYEKIIESDLIEPLIIRDVTIKAKKKTNC